MKSKKRKYEFIRRYPLFDINIVKGKEQGMDDNGQDTSTSTADMPLSYRPLPSHYIEAMTQQLGLLASTPTVSSTPAAKAGRASGTVSGYDDYQLFLINSGAEANENAQKLASFTNGRTRVLSSTTPSTAAPRWLSR
jgi:acetylornithine aminotransferase